MRTSIILPTYNEGQNLINTIGAVMARRDEISDWELVVADDGSTDGSVEAASQLWPEIRVAKHREPLGTSCAKALGADSSRGDVLIFMDAHANPGPRALYELTIAAESYGIVAPTVASLDKVTWNICENKGHGQYLDLGASWHCYWLGLNKLKHLPGSDFLYQTYSIPGEAFAIRRDVYDSIGGWDRGLVAWGSDASLTLRLWCLGYNIAHHPQIQIAHLFRRKFEQYRPHWWQIFANRLRILYTLGSDEEREIFTKTMKTRGQHFAQAEKYFHETCRTAPRMQLRITRTLTEYREKVPRRDS